MFFRKKIKYILPKGTKKIFEDIIPKPASFNIPEWFKELKSEPALLTIKGCMPFLDSLTAGYIAKFPQDMEIEHNVKGKDGKPDAFFRPAIAKGVTDPFGLNLNTEEPAVHPIEQLGKCPFVKTNKNLPFYKVLLPYFIVTPPGYSCLFTPILNNQEDRFFPVAGIVDTDKYESYVNIPIVINGDKYETLKTVFKKGTPLCQIIPFKRDNWETEVVETEKPGWYKLAYSRLQVHTKLIDNYKKYFWVKKRWK